MTGLRRVIEEFRPDEAAVEATFVNKDAAATLKLGQARGIAMLVPAQAGLAVAEYAPNVVKKTIVGAGHGDKAQIHMMIGVLLPQAPIRNPTTPPTRWRSPSATRTTGRASILKAACAMIGKLKGIIDSYGEDFVIVDVGGVGYVVHCSARTLQALPAPGEPAVAVHRDLCARGPDPPVRLPVRRRARMVPAAADRAGRRRQGRARRARHA